MTYWGGEGGEGEGRRRGGREGGKVSESIYDF